MYHKYFLSLFIFIITSTLSCRSQDIRSESDKLFIEAKSCLEKGDYNSSLLKFTRYISLEKNNKNVDTLNLMESYYNTGGIYSIFQNHAHALEMFEKGYEISYLSNNTDMQFKFLNNMIGTNCELGRPEQADKLNLRIKNIKGIDTGQLLFYYYFNKGFIADKLNDQAQKIQWMNSAIGIVEEYGLPQEMKLYPCSEIYKCHEEQEQLEEAIAVLLEYESLVHLVNNSSSSRAYLYADCYKGLMRVYTKLGNNEKALFYQNEFFLINDSLLNVTEFSKVKLQNQNYEYQQRQETIDAQQKTIFHQNTILIMLIIILSITIGASIIIYKQGRTLHNTNMALFDRNNALVEVENKSKEKVDEVDKELLMKINNVMNDENIICNPDFSLVMLAQLTDSNTNYVSRTINSYHEKNFRTFLNEYRIKIAMKRMKDNDHYGNYSIQGISESVGYKSSSNFIAAFKKTTGMPPSLYQKLSKME